METLLSYLNLASLDQLYQLNCQQLTKKFTEQQLNLLVDRLRAFLWQQKILPTSLKDGQHISIHRLDLPFDYKKDLSTHKINNITEFIQRDAIQHFTATWHPLYRSAVRVRLLCSFLPEYKDQQITALPITTQETPPENKEYSFTFVDQFPNEFLFQPWLSEKYPDDFLSPIPPIEKYLIDEVCRLPITTSRRHEIWAGAPMAADKELKKITSRVKSPEKIFDTIYNQLFSRWQQLDTFCQNNHFPAPNFTTWSNEIITVRREFYNTPRSRFRIFINNLERLTEAHDEQVAVLDIAYTAFEHLWLLPNDALLFLQQKSKDNALPPIEIFMEWLHLNPHLGKNITVLQNQSHIAQNRLVSGYIRSVLRFARNLVEKENAPEMFMDMVQEGVIGLILAAQRYDYRHTGRFITYAVTWMWQNTGRSFGELSRTIRLPVHQLEKIRILEQIREDCLETESDCSLEEICLRTDLLEVDEVQQIRAWLKDNHPVSSQLASKWHKTLKDTRKLFSYIQPIVPLSLDISAARFMLPDEYCETTAFQLADLINDENADVVKRAEQSELRYIVKKLLDFYPARTQQIINLRFGLQNGKEHTLEEIGQKLGLTRERIRQIEKIFFEKFNLAHRQLNSWLNERKHPRLLTNSTWSVALSRYIGTNYFYRPKFDDADEFQPYWEWLDTHLEKLPGLSWHQSGHKIGVATRELQLMQTLKLLKTPAHYTEITEQLNDMYETTLDERTVYAMLVRYDVTFILLGEGVFSLVEWEKERTQQKEPTIPFCSIILPDLSGQTDTFFESVLVATQYLMRSLTVRQFLNSMLQWVGYQGEAPNALKQGILNAYYLVGLLPYNFYFDNSDTLLISTLPDLPLAQLRTHCLHTLTQRLIAMPVFWWLLRQYQPVRPTDLGEEFANVHPLGLNDVANRLKLLAGLGAVRRLAYGRYELTNLGLSMANLIAEEPTQELISLSVEEEAFYDSNDFDWGIW